MTDLTERRKAEQSLRNSERDLSIRNRIAQIFLTVPDDEMYAEVLDIVCRAMKSQFGVFGYIGDQGAMVVPTMTRTIWDQCEVPDKRIVFPRETWGDSIWPRAIRQKQLLYSNEPSTGIPEGHVPITRNAVVPLIERNEVIGLFQVANKKADYDDNDLRQLQSIADHVAPILSARLARDRAIADLQRTANDLARSNADLQQFAYVASHDLQEPLRMVASFTQLLGERYRGKLDRDADDFVDFAVDGANRMQRLIQGLLEYSRVETRGKPFEPTDCGVVLDDALANLRPAIVESGAVITTDRLPIVSGDGSQLARVFQNLVGNALKFRNEGPPEVHVSAERRDDEWVLSVRDNGIGIDPQYAERIFVIFQRLHARTEYMGTGMGLAICKRIVERHGGRIWVESEPGAGATFRFTIPAGRNGQ